MPFNGSGSFSIINSFVAGTTILAAPMNQNFLDVASGLSDVLTRDGQAGMTAQFKAITGSVGAPGISFTSDATSGLYLIGAGNPGMAAGGVKAMDWSAIATFLDTGIVESGVISPTILSADQNNYAPTSIDTSSCLLLTSNTTVNITGMAGLAAGTAPVSGRMLKVVNDNASGGSNIILKNQNTSSTAANRFLMGGDLALAPLQAAILRYSGADSRWMLMGSFNFQGQSFQIPQFRLTLVSGTPVLTSDTSVTTIYYTPYLGGYVTTWDGSVWTGSAQAEVSQTLADNTKSPAATTATNNYDMFYWLDSGTFRCTRGPAWTSATARGSGAGTTELVRVNGVYMNANSITNGPAALRGVYVGSIHTGVSNTVDMIFNPSPGAGGVLPNLYLWNMYNRVDVSTNSRDSTDSWPYTTATWRAANASNSNRIQILCGLNEDVIETSYQVYVQGSTNGNGATCGVGLDATNAIIAGSTPGLMSAISVTVAPQTIRATYVGLAGLGFHFIQALERSTAAGTTTWFGDNGDATVYQMMLWLKWKM